jgi:hypothetical protein
MKLKSMKLKATILAITTVALAAMLGRAQTPGSIVAFAGSVTGAVTVASTGLGGCPTRVCTTNEVTKVRCFTNVFWKLVCTTNAAGAIQCTNIPVVEARCFTNTFPEITCTNEFLSPVTLKVSETLSGALTEAACDELTIPSNAVFYATLILDVRTNDWVGTQNGQFWIMVDTNIVAYGSMIGVTGLRTPLPDGPCAACNGFQGTLRGTVYAPGALHDAKIEAAYAGVLSDVACPSANVPQGPVQVVIDGVVVVPCLDKFCEF